MAERAVMRALGWEPGQRASLRVVDAAIQVAADPLGAIVIGHDGNLRLPIGVRRRCCLAPGDRVFLAATPPSGLLHLYPPAVLDAVIQAGHTSASAGGAS